MDGQTQRMVDYSNPTRRIGVMADSDEAPASPSILAGNSSQCCGSPVQQPVSGLSADAVRKVVTKLRRIPNMADRQGADSPSVWMKLGECIADLEMLLGEAE